MVRAPSGIAYYRGRVDIVDKGARGIPGAGTYDVFKADKLTTKVFRRGRR